MDMANEIIRETYRGKKSSLYGYRELSHLRRAMLSARRYILDDSMSEFLAVVSHVPFACAVERRPDVLDSMRHSAVPPYDVMFLQWDNRAFRRGVLDIGKSTDVRGAPLETPEGDLVPELGFLIEKFDHGTFSYVRLTQFIPMHFGVATMPFTYVYMIGDQAWRAEPKKGDVKVDTLSGIFAHGLTAHHDLRIGVAFGDGFAGVEQFPIRDRVKVINEWNGETFDTHQLVVEFGGVVRHVMAFLATLDHVPKTTVERVGGKSYVGGGAVRRPVDSTVVTLRLPRSGSVRRLAERMMVKVRRGWHEVQPHWRMLSSGERRCAQHYMHIWSETDSTGHAHCKECDARRVWIVLPRGRGDPSIGVNPRRSTLVTHSRRREA